MWSQRFLRFGLISSVITALVVLVLIRHLLGLPIQNEWKLGFFSQFLFPVVARGAVFSFGLLALPIYPLCWYWLVYRARNYDARKLPQLLFGSYALGWIAILFCYFPIVLRDRLIVRGQFTESVAEAAVAAFYQSCILAGSGALLLLLPYTITALPALALQRGLLLRFFRTRPA